MIGYHDVESRVLISSLELYNALERDHKKYYKWIKQRVVFNSSLDIPRYYFIHKHRPLNLFMSVSLTKAILVREGTIVARNLRLYIEEKIERNPNKRPMTIEEFIPPQHTPLKNLYFLHMPGGKRLERLRAS